MSSISGLSGASMNIVGICRFSMLGRGDWLPYRGVKEADLEPIYETQAQKLFTPERMEARLASFEHLTVKSLREQTDQDFTFLVVSSDRMPEPYKTRLTAICADVKQIRLRFSPPAPISAVLTDMLNELDLHAPDTLQFRLDDDDCVSRHFIGQLRRHGTALWDVANFGISLSNHFYCVLNGASSGVWKWNCAFLGTGSAVRTRNHSIFSFGHFAIPRRMLCVTDPFFPNIITHNVGNDTGTPSEEKLRQRGMNRVSPDELARTIKGNFGFLDERGLALCGFDRALRAADEDVAG